MLACAILVPFACVASGEVDDGILMPHILNAQVFRPDYSVTTQKAGVYICACAHAMFLTDHKTWII
jgi:hypothetical protein